ncbi:MAG: hypothetical protein ACFFAY_02395 [Promethearchaeota archaeon]
MTLDSDLALMSIDEQHVVMESIGRTVSEEKTSQFEKLLRKTTISGILDVTGWTLPAIRTLLLVCRDKDQILNLKCDERYLSVVKFPTGPILDSLAKAIMTDKW